MEKKNSVPTGRIFINFDIGVFFANLSRKCSFFLLRLTRMMVTLREDVGTFMIISRPFLPIMRNVSGVGL